MWLHNVCTPSFVIIRKSSSKNVGNCISGYSSDTMEGTKPPVAAIHPSYLLIWLLMQMLQGNANIKEALYVFSVLHYCTTAEEGVSIQSYITSQIIFFYICACLKRTPYFILLQHLLVCFFWRAGRSLCGVNENGGMNNDSALWLHRLTRGDVASCSFPVMIWNFCFALRPVRNTNAPLWMYSRGN